jgi:hypothetical protein
VPAQRLWIEQHVRPFRMDSGRATLGLGGLKLADWLPPAVPARWYYRAIGPITRLRQNAPLRLRDMLSAMLLVISITALAQFALYYWRAVLAGVAAQPVSDRVLVAAGLNQGHVTGNDFGTLAGLHDLTPDLQSGKAGLGFVRLYYHLVDGLGLLASTRLPALAAWSKRESAVCARYAAVQVDRRLDATLALAASLRGC